MEYEWEHSKLRGQTKLESDRVLCVVAFRINIIS